MIVKEIKHTEVLMQKKGNYNGICLAFSLILTRRRCVKNADF